MVALNFFKCINRTQLEQFFYEVEGSKKIEKAKSEEKQ